MLVDPVQRAGSSQCKNRLLTKSPGSAVAGAILSQVLPWWMAWIAELRYSAERRQNSLAYFPALSFNFGNLRCCEPRVMVALAGARLAADSSGFDGVLSILFSCHPFKIGSSIIVSIVVFMVRKFSPRAAPMESLGYEDVKANPDFTVVLRKADI